ncbi:MAG: hypothetical protein ACI9XJ_002448, partial [Marivirga sp.]
MLRNKFTVIIAALLFCLGSSTYGQQPNDWINFNQTYYKISISQEGVYQLTYDDLVEAEIQLSAIDARTFRLYHRGQEVAILVNGQSDGRLDPADNIQFLAKANDGTLDTFLYDDPSSQPHTFYNLYSDETAYFLTWSLDGSAGKRMEQVNPINNSNGLAPESSLISTVRAVQVNSFSLGKPFAPNNEVRNSSFSIGEGFSGTVFTGSSTVILNGVNQQNRAQDNLSFELLIQGRNNRSHSVEILIGP